ncbi:cation diffusion facilitator family transporter [Angulomicrobium tetraedrale]|uniref:Cation diffusion facilitator family transporter n=1 Tax=Ancylobacter tetraedralis TaxID=217068 RepID=A0A839Z5F9_9HYPH|nr:CDF family Co(II)/Ni(II) efflux transporter DmeF [Ancylobacter tetraedralis]MBB3769750.1 cation diffusion facilitator family transporter [Ancylobacter tetraedralis]
MTAPTHADAHGRSAAHAGAGTPAAGPLSDTHAHSFLGAGHGRHERRTWIVIAITASVMVLEIVAGSLFGSMALLADGWHMSTHAAAMLITALAYRYAARHAQDPRFSFGTGKVGDLAAFASAIVLALVALLIGVESALRLAAPVQIDFNEAIAVAVFGLSVNLVCAWLLRDDHEHAHGQAHGHHHGQNGGSAHTGHHDHDHGHHEHRHDEHEHHEHGHAHPHAARGVGAQVAASSRDNNLRAAYLHVMTDALTSVFAILALLGGSLYGFLWLDPVIGIVGALVVARWSLGLVRDTARVLLDFTPRRGIPQAIRTALEASGARVTDLHVWQVGPGHFAAAIALRATEPQAPAAYKQGLEAIEGLSHITLEVNALDAPALPRAA